MLLMHWADNEPFVDDDDNDDDDDGDDDDDKNESDGKLEQCSRVTRTLQHVYA